MPAIVEIKDYLDTRPGGATLAGLEHLDDRYLKAVGYATKSKTHSRPKMVLFGDIVGEDKDAVAAAASHVVRIADSVKDCLRCGKCKPVCSTHVPRANLLYSPRNKILATSLLVEAFLYEEQTQRGISIKHFDEFSDVADHCTIYHKCLNPCPVDIDFGDVSIAIHEYLLEKGVKLQGVQGVRYMYHDPCHSPMKTYQPMKVVNELMGNGVAQNDRCCGESGTLAVTRPDVSTQVRFRKEEEIEEGRRYSAR